MPLNMHWQIFFDVCDSYEYLNDFMDSMEVKQVKKKNRPTNAYTEASYESSL